MGMSNEELLNSLQQMIDTAERRMAEMCGMQLYKKQEGFTGKVFNIFVLNISYLGVFVRSTERVLRGIYFPMQSINLNDNQLVKLFVVQIWFIKNGYHLSLNRTGFEGESTNANIGNNLQTGKESGLNLSGRKS